LPTSNYNSSLQFQLLNAKTEDSKDQDSAHFEGKLYFQGSQISFWPKSWELTPVLQ